MASLATTNSVDFPTPTSPFLLYPLLSSTFPTLNSLLLFFPLDRANQYLSIRPTTVIKIVAQIQPRANAPLQFLLQIPLFLLLRILLILASHLSLLFFMIFPLLVCPSTISTLGPGTRRRTISPNTNGQQSRSTASCQNASTASSLAMNTSSLTLLLLFLPLFPLTLHLLLLFPLTFLLPVFAPPSLMHTPPETDASASTSIATSSSTTEDRSSYPLSSTDRTPIGSSK